MPWASIIPRSVKKGRKTWQHSNIPSIIFHKNDIHVFRFRLMHHVKGEEVDSLDGGNVFSGHIRKVVPGILNRDFVSDNRILLVRLQ